MHYLVWCVNNTEPVPEKDLAEKSNELPVIVSTAVTG